MSPSHDAFDASQYAWRNILAVEARDSVALISSIQKCIGQPVAAADAQGKQTIG